MRGGGFCDDPHFTDSLTQGLAGHPNAASLRLIYAFPNSESSGEALVPFLGSHFLSFQLLTEFLYLGVNANWGSWPLASKGTSRGLGGIVQMGGVVSTALIPS